MMKVKFISIVILCVVFIIPTVFSRTQQDSESQLSPDFPNDYGSFFNTNFLNYNDLTSADDLEEVVKQGEQNIPQYLDNVFLTTTTTVAPELKTTIDSPVLPLFETTTRPTVVPILPTTTRPAVIPTIDTTPIPTTETTVATTTGTTAPPPIPITETSISPTIVTTTGTPRSPEVPTVIDSPINSTLQVTSTPPIITTTSLPLTPSVSNSTGFPLVPASNNEVDNVTRTSDKDDERIYNKPGIDKQVPWVYMVVPIMNVTVYSSDPEDEVEPLVNFQLPIQAYLFPLTSDNVITSFSKPDFGSLNFKTDYDFDENYGENNNFEQYNDYPIFGNNPYSNANEERFDTADELPGANLLDYPGVDHDPFWTNWLYAVPPA